MIENDVVKMCFENSRHQILWEECYEVIDKVMKYETRVRVEEIAVRPLWNMFGTRMNNIISMHGQELFNRYERNT